MINGATMLDASAKAPPPDRGYARRVDAGCHVHPEITAAPIHASSRPDVRGLPLCDALIRYRRPTGSLITVCAPHRQIILHHGALFAERGHEAISSWAMHVNDGT